MTRIRTGNNRRRAMTARSIRNRYRFLLDLETRALNEDLASLLARVKFLPGGADAASAVPSPLPDGVEDIQRIVASFTEGTLPIPGFHPRLDPIHHLRTVDDASKASHAAAAERLGAMTRDAAPPYLPPRYPLGEAAGNGFAEFGELSDAERELLDRTLTLFAAPDRGMSAGHAELVSRQPTYDEYVAGLPDGLPASDGTAPSTDPG